MLSLSREYPKSVGRRDNRALSADSVTTHAETFGRVPVDEGFVFVPSERGNASNSSRDRDGERAYIGASRRGRHRCDPVAIAYRVDHLLRHADVASLCTTSVGVLALRHHRGAGLYHHSPLREPHVTTLDSNEPPTTLVLTYERSGGFQPPTAPSTDGQQSSYGDLQALSPLEGI